VNGRTSYLPSTFEERGTAVPFATPLLTQARVRRNDRGKLELSMPRFAETSAAFVVPWDAVPTIISLNGHDRALHAAVADGGLVDPHAIRLAALRIAGEGLAGPEAARLAALALRTEEEYRVFTNALLIASVVAPDQTDRSTEAVQALVQGINTPDGQRQTRAALLELARQRGVGLRELYSLLSELSTVVAPVGLPTSPRRGRLRSLTRRLAEFHNSAVEIANADAMLDVAQSAQSCANVARFTYRIATARLAEFDALLSNPRHLMTRWELAHPAVERLVQGLAWLLDGWDFIAEWWFTALRQPPGPARNTNLHATLSLVPMVPRDELTRAGILKEAAAFVSVRGRGWVREKEDWRTGAQIESEVKRILAANTLAA
jgi:hypothetical protein